ncbi:efflux transporter outer membrane subunit [Comamonas faecalis]|uniref:Efflux transporter outer membrane subunit n=2 Tax=Comamonas faecalis TaxID=1387849 RepID=A0ABP7QGE4_9BURK
MHNGLPPAPPATRPRHGALAVRLLAWGLALGGALLAGCSTMAPTTGDVVADMARPAAHWKESAPEGWVRTTDESLQGLWQQQRWWPLFGDAQLDALMERVEVGNQNIAQAAASVAQAQALLQQSQAQRWPTLGLQAGGSRSGDPARGSATLGLAASWAPDLWGRVGAQVQAQQAAVQASEADLAGARLAAQASLAQGYFALREADAELLLMDEIIAGYTRSLQITDNRYRAGVAAHTDLLQAQTTLENARATRAGLQRTRALTEHALALLVGEPPAQFTLASAPWVRTAPQLPLLLPSELLLRRPDVAASERDVAAANAGIGVARAAWFPSVNLSAGLGGAAASAGELLSAPVLAWSLGASLAQTLLDAGARDAAVQQAVAAQQAASARYRQTALGAMGEVEDQLSTLRTLERQIAHQGSAADAAAGAEQRMLNSYEAGLSDYTSVVTAQASTLSARRSLMQLQLQQQQAVVALVQALGGGWQAPWAQQ